MSTAAGIGASVLTNAFNNAQNYVYNSNMLDRQYVYGRNNMMLSHQLGEQSADAADLRTRELYSDLYSPNAVMKQLKEAGLSPGLFYSNGYSGGGTSGAQAGTPAAAGVNPLGLSQRGLLDNAEVALLQSQARKNNAEAGAKEDENKRENEKQSYIVQNLEMSTNRMSKEIDKMSSEIKNIDAQSRLIELNSEYQEIVNFIKGATTTNELASSAMQLQMLYYQIELLKKEDYFREETMQDSIAQIKATLNQTYVSTRLQAAQTKLAESQIELSDYQMSKIVQEIDNMKIDNWYTINKNSREDKQIQMMEQKLIQELKNMKVENATKIAKTILDYLMAPSQALGNIAPVLK